MPALRFFVPAYLYELALVLLELLHFVPIGYAVLSVFQVALLVCLHCASFLLLSSVLPNVYDRCVVATPDAKNLENKRRGP